MAFTWQAKVIRKGVLSIPSPQPNPKSFPVPFVLDYQGNKFSKYPISWPVVLAFGEWLRIRAMINPILSGVSFWFIYRLVKKVLDERTALLAIILGSISPFILINSGSLLSHPWSLLLTTTFMISWLDAFTVPNPALSEKYSRWLPAITGGFALGLLSLTRPWTAAGISLPFVIHAVIILMRKPNRTFNPPNGHFLRVGIFNFHPAFHLAIRSDRRFFHKSIHACVAIR